MSRIFPVDFTVQKTSLEFDGSEIKRQLGSESMTKVNSILNELDEKSKTFIESEIPALFSKLVETLRLLDQRQMEQVYETNRLTRVWRFLVDAAPMVATPASMAIVSNLITTGQMTAEEADVWYTSMAFIPNPDSDMFRELPVSDEGW